MTGFLRSCRQAYTEGVDVLYSSNLISIGSETLLLHLPKLIPVNRLASIKSLEIVVKAKVSQEQDSRWSYDLNHLEPILDNIVTSCVTLRRICLALKVSSRHSEILDGTVLPLLDQFYHSTRLREMKVELPFADYQATFTRLLQHPREAPAKWMYQTYWRCLDGEEPSIQHRYTERFLFSPLKLPVPDDGEESVEGTEYWFSEGNMGPGPVAFGCGNPWPRSPWSGL